MHARCGRRRACRASPRRIECLRRARAPRVCCVHPRLRASSWGGATGMDAESAINVVGAVRVRLHIHAVSLAEAMYSMGSRWRFLYMVVKGRVMSERPMRQGARDCETWLLTVTIRRSLRLSFAGILLSLAKFRINLNKVHFVAWFPVWTKLMIQALDSNDFASVFFAQVVWSQVLPHGWILYPSIFKNLDRPVGVQQWLL